MKKFIDCNILLNSIYKIDIIKNDFINKELFEQLFCDRYDFPVTTLIQLAEVLGLEVGNLFVEKSVNILYFR